MAFAFILPDACRAAEAALARLVADMVGWQGRQIPCKLTPDDIDFLRGRINASRLRLVADEYLRELWPAPHVAIGVKNNVPLLYAAGVLGSIADALRSLAADCPPESIHAARLSLLSKELLDIRAIIDDAVPVHLRRERVERPEIVSNPDNVTIGEIVLRYIDELTRRVEKNEMSPDNLRNSKPDLLRFVNAVGTRAVADLRQHDLTLWLEQNPQWKSIHTRRRVANTLIACFRWAAEEQYIVSAPFRSPRALRGISPVVRRPADQREYVLLMRKGSRALRLALFFLRRSGARTSEMRSVTWNDLRLDDTPPNIFLTKHKTARQSDKPRIIPLDATLARVLRAMKRRAEKRGDLNGEERIFTNCDGSPWDRHTFARHLRRWAKRIGLDEDVVSRMSAYMLRHSFVVEAIEAGVGIRQIADVVGHSKLDTINQFYGSHCRHRAHHLGSVMDEINAARQKKRRGSEPKQ